MKADVRQLPLQPTKRKRRHLTEMDKSKLWIWVAQDGNIDGLYTRPAIAKKAKAALGIEHIADSAIVTALKACGKAMPTPPSKEPLVLPELKPAGRIFAEQLLRVCTQLHVPLNPEFVALLDLKKGAS